MTNQLYDNTHGDPLDAPWLTPKIWAELVNICPPVHVIHAENSQFDIYERHFATDFPFLHRKRFLRPLHQPPPVDASAAKRAIASQPRPPHDPPLLLAFLTQTARYHPEIVSRVGHKPIATAEYFAEATRKRLGSLPGKASLERAQALLFLGNHEWTELEGEQAWLTIGIAIRYTQVLGYQHDEVRKRANATHCGDEFEQQERFIEREVERRTFWSCFIMDRFLSAGEQRPQMLNIEKFNIQLPCSNKAFSRGREVKTRFLGEDDEKYAGRRQGAKDATYKAAIHPYYSDPSHHGCTADSKVEWEVGEDEGELSLYIHAVAHFGRVMEWAIDGGRR